MVVILAGVSAALHLAKLIPALPVLKDSLGISLVQAGFLLSTVQMAGMTLGLVIGVAADGLGLKRSLLSGLCVLLLASALGGFTQSASVLIAFRALEGLGFLLAVTPAPGLIRRLVTDRRLGGMLGLWGAYMPFAIALALMGGPLVIALGGWQCLWWGLSMLSLLMLVWVFQVVPADPPKASFRFAPMSMRERLRVTLASSGPWLVALCFAVYSGQWLAVIGFLPMIYSQAGLAVEAAAWLTALAAAANMVGNIASGRALAAGVKVQTLLWTGFGVMGASAFIAFAEFSFLPWGHPGVMLRFGAVVAFSMVGGIIPGTLFSLAVRLAPGDETVSTTVGWMQQCSALGQFFGPPLVAWVAVHFGGWQWTWVATGACAILGAWLSWHLGRATARLPASEM